MSILSPSCFPVCGHHLSPRIAIVFSLLSSLRNSSMSHPSKISSSPLMHSVPPCIFHIILPCDSYSLLLSHTDTHFFVATLSSSRLLVDYISFFFLVGPGPLHKITVSFFSRSPFWPCRHVFIPISSLDPPHMRGGAQNNKNGDLGKISSRVFMGAHRPAFALSSSSPRKPALQIIRGLCYLTCYRLGYKLVWGWSVLLLPGYLCGG